MPLLAIAAVAVGWLVHVYNVDQDRRQADTTRALALAVDAEIRSWKTVLQTLAESQALAEGRLADFYREARAVAARHEGWIVLSDGGGRQRLNTLRPWGDRLPMAGAPAMVQAIFRDGQPAVTDLASGAVAQRYIVAAAVPVVRAGHVVYALSMSFGPDRLTGLLADQRFPASWITTITDGQQRVVARVPERLEREGQPVLPPLAKAFAAQGSGAIDATLTDGRIGHLVFQRLHEAPWTVNVMVPVAELLAAWQRPAFGFGLLALLAALGAVGLAVGLARWIARPVQDAARVAAAVVHGEAPRFPPSRIAEVAALQEALADGALTVQTALRAREAAAKALRQANETLEERVAERTVRLAASEARLAALFHGSPVGIVLSSLDGRLLEVNDTVLRMFGYDAAEVVGRTAEDLGAWVDPTQRTALLWQVPPAGAVHDCEAQLRRKSGEVFPALISAQYLTLGGEPVLVSGILDITDRKRAEEERRSVALFPEQNPNPVLRIAENGRVLYANAGSEPLLQQWQVRVGEQLAPAQRTAILGGAASGRPGEILVRCDERIYSLMSVPVPECGYINVYGRDVTLGERTLAQLQESLARERQVSADNQALLREVHHRVKNNLQMLCDLMYLQMEAMPDRDQHPDLQDAYSRIYAIARLHEQIHQTMEGGRIRLEDYLRRLAGGFENLFRDVPVKVEAAADGLTLDLDRAIHVGLIVNELITNAVKHAFPKGQRGEVTVSLRTLGDQIQLQVHDNGQGLPEDFDLERAKSVGLRTVRILACRLEARVAVTSTGGTCFTLTFPLHAEEPIEPK